LTAIAIQPVITPVDRFGLTLSLAIIVHGIIILGVTFTPEEMITPRYETMEIILVQQESEMPEEAKLLAQVNLDGGGDSIDPINPATPIPAPFPKHEPDEVAPPPANIQEPETAAQPTVETTEIEQITEPAEIIEQIAVDTTKEEVANVENIKETKKEKEPTEQIIKPIKKDQGEKSKTVPEAKEIPPLPSATTLLINSFKIASLSAEIRRKMQDKANRPRRKFISASTKEYKYAAYMEAWRTKVERVGNLNYPDDARKKKLSGSLILDVALNADGTVNQITVRKSSKSKILDDAAVRIVELSSPFSPFPDHIRKETDILHITRTWQFLNNHRFK